MLFVGHTRYALPLPTSLAKKWDALTQLLEPRVIGAEAPDARHGDDPRFRLLRRRVPASLGSPTYYASLPAVVAAEARRFQPHAILCESPYAGCCALLARSALKFGTRPKVIVEVHGDWRTAPRLYGSRWRQPYAPLSDRAAETALRSADATRAVSQYTAKLIERVTRRPPLAVFPTYTDIEIFSLRPVCPLPDVPTALWVGVLEPYKNADGLPRIWRNIANRVPTARLVVVGKGPLHPALEELAQDLPGRVELVPELLPAQIAERLDDSTLLILPSRSEGFPRVIIEAFARGRPVIASEAGGIPDIVVSGRNGVLAPVEDNEAFADAVANVLSDPALADRLAAGARVDGEPLLQWTPSRYARAVYGLVEQALASPGRSGTTAGASKGRR